MASDWPISDINCTATYCDGLCGFGGFNKVFVANPAKRAKRVADLPIDLVILIVGRIVECVSQGVQDFRGGSLRVRQRNRSEGTNVAKWVSKGTVQRQRGNFVIRFAKNENGAAAIVNVCAVQSGYGA